MNSIKTKSVLVIKHGSLGDIIQATEAFRCIKERHKDDIVSVMTRKPFKAFLSDMKLFDNVIVDEYPKINPMKYYRTLKGINNFDIVYDLQHSNRTARYRKMLFFKKQWSTIPCEIDKKNISAFWIFKEQMKQSGITGYRDYPYLDFMSGDLSMFNLPKKFAIIVSGCSARGNEKKWIAKGFADVANYILSKEIMPVFIGTNDDRETVDEILPMCYKYIDLCGKTNLGQIAELGRTAKLAIGIDTGPMHIVGGVGCKSIILFNNKVTSARKSLAIGKDIIPIEVDNLTNLTSTQVVNAISL